MFDIKELEDALRYFRAHGAGSSSLGHHSGWNDFAAEVIEDYIGITQKPKVEVETPVGTLIASSKGDTSYPGIFIDLKNAANEGNYPDLVAVVEYDHVNAAMQCVVYDQFNDTPVKTVKIDTEKTTSLDAEEIQSQEDAQTQFPSEENGGRA